MTELPPPELPPLTESQEASLKDICERYGVKYAREHYTVRFDLPEGYVAGFVGGWDIQENHPTIYIGCSQEGAISS